MEHACDPPNGYTSSGMKAVYRDGVVFVVFVVIAMRVFGDVEIGDCIIIFGRCCGKNISHKQSSYEQERRA